MKPAHFYVTATVCGQKYGLPKGRTNHGRNVVILGYPQNGDKPAVVEVYGINSNREPELFGRFVRFADGKDPKKDLREPIGV